MKRTETSKWKDSEGRIVTVVGTKYDCLNDKDWVFQFVGRNPFPFKECRGSYQILADWLIAHDYVRVFKSGHMRPDTVTIVR